MKPSECAHHEETLDSVEAKELKEEHKVLADQPVILDTQRVVYRQRLPEAIWASIFTYASAFELGSIAPLVSHEWRVLSRQSWCWYQLYHRLYRPRRWLAPTFFSSWFDAVECRSQRAAVLSTALRSDVRHWVSPEGLVMLHNESTANVGWHMSGHIAGSHTDVCLERIFPNVRGIYSSTCIVVFHINSDIHISLYFRYIHDIFRFHISHLFIFHIYEYYYSKTFICIEYPADQRGYV